MVPAAVGFQCPDCVKTHTRATRKNLGIFSGQLSNDSRHTSMILIGINAIVWGIIQLSSYFGIQDRIVTFLGLLPQGICAVADSSGGFYSGVGQASCQMIPTAVWIPGVADGAWWQIFTSLFTHVSFLHIGVNCLSLWFLGPPLEAMLGRTRFLTTYVIAGLFGSVAVYWLSAPISLSYGGSGSLFGLMGALLILLWKRRADVRQLLAWLGINVLITFIGGGSISWQAHMGGLVGGGLVACAWVFVPPSSTRTRTQGVLIGVLVAIIAIGLVVRTAMLS
jgi:membrane associated rhomboid family serine protease